MTIERVSVSVQFFASLVGAFAFAIGVSAFASPSQRPVRLPMPDQKSRPRYVLHVPPNPPQNAPLVVMIHGCKEDAFVFEDLTQMDAIADQNGFYVLYPNQEFGANISNCWNWYVPTNQAVGLGEPAKIINDIDEVSSKYSIDSTRVYVAGLSSGAAMTAILMSCYPGRFAGGAIHAGLAYGYASDVLSALNQMKSGPDQNAIRNQSCQPANFKGRVLIVHGTADETVNFINTDSMLADFTGQTKAIATPLELIMPSGHKLGYERNQYSTLSASRVQSLFIKDMKHAWSGGKPGVAYGDPNGPNASLMTWQFFSEP